LAKRKKEKESTFSTQGKTVFSIYIITLVNFSS